MNKNEKKRGYVLITVVFIMATIFIIILSTVVSNILIKESAGRIELAEYSYENAENSLEDVLFRMAALGDVALVPPDATTPVVACYPTSDPVTATSKITIRMAQIASTSSDDSKCPDIAGDKSYYYSIESTGKYNDYYRTLRVCADLSGGIDIIQWKEIDPTPFTTCT